MLRLDLDTENIKRKDVWRGGMVEESRMIRLVSWMNDYAIYLLWE